jgi:hypothetical protein
MRNGKTPESHPSGASIATPLIIPAWQVFDCPLPVPQGKNYHTHMNEVLRREMGSNFARTMNAAFFTGLRESSPANSRAVFRPESRSRR